MLIARRSLLIAASVAAAPRAAWAQQLSPGVFTHGVASGDPLPDGVILWTRFVAPAGDGRVAWEVAEDEAFTSVTARGQATSSFASDFCAKADVRGLSPGRSYFYRFLSAAGPSPTGRTRTAPAGAVRSLTIALFSCANFPYGYFHAYGHAAAREDIDLVIHTGDYIYEGQRGGYPSTSDSVPGRLIDPVTEIVTLSDYYQRYATYHTDHDLLELRRLKPMSVVWDDHELANDAWIEGAQAHQTPDEGAWSDRVAAATKAYFDWMPIRRPTPQGHRLYRSLDWGDLARILFLDTRLAGRTRQLDYRNSVQAALDTPGEAAALDAFRRELNDPARSMLGQEQERWLAETMAGSKASGQRWQVVAQQIIVGEQIAPPGWTRLLPNNASTGNRQWHGNAERLTPQGLPWNLDNWSGYPAARERFLNACAANARNALVLGGDSHNCWLYDLRAPNSNNLAALEFAGGSVSSAGFERALTEAGPGEREAMISSVNPSLKYVDLTRRGYGVTTLTRTSCTAEWVAFDEVRNPQAPQPSVHRMVAAASESGGSSGWLAS